MALAMVAGSNSMNSLEKNWEWKSLRSMNTSPRVKKPVCLWNKGSGRQQGTMWSNFRQPQFYSRPRLLRRPACRSASRHYDRVLFIERPSMSSLFSPLKLGPVELSNRIAVSPMCQYSADDGSVTDWHMAHLGMLSNCGAGLVIVEATHVERAGRITHGCVGLYSDHNEAALERVIEHCRRAGTAKWGIQIAHAGRKASAQRPWEGGGALKPGQDPWETLAPSAL